jgi:penicillin amidase
VAATIFSVWRNQLLRSVVLEPITSRGLRIARTRRDPFATARYLLENFDRQRGIGASGLNFFNVPGIDDAPTRRDVIILRGLARTLDLLAGDAFSTAFARSTNQNDYRWGRLHRVIFDHPLGAPFSIPPAGGAFPAPQPGLPGIPVDGGTFSVDVANTMVPNMVNRPDDADSPAAFVFRFGPGQRYVARARSFGFESEASQAGGASGVPGSPFYLNLLEEWLTNRTHPLRQSRQSLIDKNAEIQIVLPARKH